MKVSIICTVYNKELWIAQAIDSFLEQETDFEFEVILVDDASTDQSRVVLADYAQKYPEQIRVFYNEENLGIARTWAGICQEARGEYIARCDGDDFWLDSKKLQKQVEALEAAPDSKWSNCDFDIFNEKGEKLSSSGFENATIPLADTYEKMLATRGFTMASTWLVERELMLEVNQELDMKTADDTFNLQLDLFKRTKLTYLPESMVAYRVSQGSDSRPKNFETLRSRFDRLLATQLYYVDKYPQSDFKEMTEILLDRNNHYEIELSKMPAHISQIGQQKVTIYFEDEHDSFSQDNILQKVLEREGQIPFTLPEAIKKIRIDLSEIPSFYSQVSLIDADNHTEILPVHTNGFIVSNHYFFPEHDPQLIYEIHDYHGKHLVLNYKMMNVDDVSQSDYVADVLGKELKELYEKLEAQTVRQIELAQLKEENDRLKQETEEAVHRYNSVIHSRRWVMMDRIMSIFRKRK